MRRLLAALFSCAALPAAAATYTVRDSCPTYKVGRGADGVAEVRCVVGKLAYRLPGVCRDGTVEYWQRGGRVWLWCRGQPRPSAAM